MYVTVYVYLYLWSLMIRVSLNSGYSMVLWRIVQFYEELKPLFRFLLLNILWKHQLSHNCHLPEKKKTTLTNVKVYIFFLLAITSICFTESSLFLFVVTLLFYFLVLRSWIFLTCFLESLRGRKDCPPFPKANKDNCLGWFFPTTLLLKFDLGQCQNSVNGWGAIGLWQN